MISLERLKQKLSNIAARYTVSNPSLRWQTTPKRGVVRDTWLGMLKSFFSWYLILRSKNSIFSIIIYQPMWETGFDGRQVRLCVVNTLKKRLVVPSAPRPCDSLAASAAALVHSSNSHCLAHTTFSMRTVARGIVDQRLLRRCTGAHQLRRDKADIKRHPAADMLGGGPTDKLGKRLPVSRTCELKATHQELKSDTHWWNWLCFQQPYIKASSHAFTVQTRYTRGVNKESDRGETGRGQLASALAAGGLILFSRSVNPSRLLASLAESDYCWLLLRSISAETVFADTSVRWMVCLYKLVQLHSAVNWKRYSISVNRKRER